MNENPYTAPQSAPELAPAPQYQDTELASRWARLGASIIDALVMMVTAVPLIFLVIYFVIMKESQTSESLLNNFQTASESILWNMVNALIGITVYVAINGYFLVKSGQSIGKKALGIQIVDYHSNQLLPASKVLGMRYVLTQVLSNIPFVGSLFSLVNVLFIFGSEKRCIHDLMANSKVIKKAL